MAQDSYANIMAAEVVESAAGTITFTEMLTGAGFGSNRGMVIDEIDYFIPQATATLMDADNDRLHYGLTLSSGVTDLEDSSDTRILHSAGLNIMAIGTAASGVIMFNPQVYQFFPPLIHGQPRIFLAIVSGALASAATIRVRIYWRYVDLTPAAILEIAETFAVVA